MQNNLVDLKDYRPKVNEVGEIDVDTLHAQECESRPRSYLAVIGCVILIILIVLGLIMPAFAES